MAAAEGTRSDRESTPTAAARRAEVAEAGHRGDETVLRAGLSDRDPGVRATALGGLRRASRLEAADLTAGLTDVDAGVRRRAVQEVAALAGTDGTGTIPAGVSVLALLDDEDLSVVEVAAWASGERVPPEEGAVNRLADLVGDHPDALVREAAVAALGAIGDPAGLAAVLVGTRDKATVRRRAVLALAPFSGPDVDAALRAAAHDRDWQVRQAAEDLGR